MTDRQIEVLERLLKALVVMDVALYPNTRSKEINEFSLIIEEQKALNLISLRSQRSSEVNNTTIGTK